MTPTPLFSPHLLVVSLIILLVFLSPILLVISLSFCPLQQKCYYQPLKSSKIVCVPNGCPEADRASEIESVNKSQFPRVSIQKPGVAVVVQVPPPSAFCINFPSFIFLFVWRIAVPAETYSASHSQVIPVSGSGRM